MKTLQIIAAVGGRKAIRDITGLHRATISYWAKNGIPQPWLFFLQAHFPQLKWKQLLDDTPEMILKKNK